MPLVSEAKDLYDAMLPVFVLSKILGLAPFEYQRTRRRCYKFHWGPVTFLRIIVIIGIMGYVAVLLHDDTFDGSLDDIALRCELYFGTIVTSIALILAVTNQGMLIKAVDNIIEIDHDMRAVDIKISYKNAQKFTYFQIIGITAVFTSKLIMQPFSSKSFYVPVYNAFNVVDYVNTIMLFQYVDALLLLRQRYIWLNREVQAIGMQKIIYSDFKLLPGKNALSFEKTGYLSPENFIVALGKIHAKLYKTAKLVNRTYGIQLLCSICARFIMITTQLINVYKILGDSSLGSPVQYALISVYLFLHSSKVFMIASISANAAAKARDTGIYLHKLWDVSSTMKNKINFFSLQVLHQNLSFSAAGFFVLDYTLIQSIVGAVTTYLIIIIQFDVNRK